MKPNGYIIHKDTQRVVIATGFSRPSENVKTGPTIQIWVLPSRQNPVEAVASGRDSVVCGNCPLRGQKGEGRACYVNLGKAPLAVWRTWQAGGYPPLPSLEVFRGHRVRFGAYGDPAFIPLPLLRSIAQACDGWTGYTHQWRSLLFQSYRYFLMASVEDTAGEAHARGWGWRTFRVVPKEAPAPVDALECLSDSKGLTCRQCGLCGGAQHASTPSIWIRAHGSGAKYVPTN